MHRTRFANEDFRDARRSGARDGLAATLRPGYLGAAGDPLPALLADLILALRRREREWNRSERAGRMVGA